MLILLDLALEAADSLERFSKEQKIN